LGNPGPNPADSRQCARPWWNWPTQNTLDRATTHLPALLYERLDELGIDYSILYPSLGLAFTDMLDGELCQVLCRAVNTIYADEYRPFADRLTPAAVIPMHTPEMAIEETEYATSTLGLKTILIDGFVTASTRSCSRTSNTWTSSRSTASSTTTRSGGGASSSSWRRCHTADSSSSDPPGRRRTTCSTTSTR
jgi:hypothetical protein